MPFSFCHGGFKIFYVIKLISLIFYEFWIWRNNFKILSHSKFIKGFSHVEHKTCYVCECVEVLTTPPRVILNNVFLYLICLVGIPISAPFYECFLSRVRFEVSHHSVEKSRALLKNKRRWLKFHCKEVTVCGRGREPGGSFVAEVTDVPPAGCRSTHLPPPLPRGYAGGAQEYPPSCGQGSCLESSQGGWTGLVAVTSKWKPSQCLSEGNGRPARGA